MRPLTSQHSACVLGSRMSLPVSPCTRARRPQRPSPTASRPPNCHLQPQLPAGACAWTPGLAGEPPGTPRERASKGPWNSGEEKRKAGHKFTSA